MGKLIGFLLALAVLGAVVAGGGWFWLNGQYTAAGPASEDGKPRLVVVEKGAGTQAIATSLKEAGVITDADQFRLILRAREFLGEKPVMKAGEYAIPSGASMEAVVAELTTGASMQYAVIIPEGLSNSQIIEMLTTKSWAATSGAELDYKLTGEAPKDLSEGVLLPGDYAVSRGDTVADVVTRMREAQTALLDEIWDKRAADVAVKTREEAIILASIVEKETGNADEQPTVAGLYSNRLRQGIRMQADATIVYGITKGVPLGRSITTKEIGEANDWNTYQRDGLPKTPICNPGAGAIRAALNPAKTDAIYMMADGEGGHLFAASYAEHQRNVDAYWKLRKQNEAAGKDTPAVKPKR
ncbi:MAG: hypothetical protein B7Z38_04105 [Rhodobacterales bacterium 12-64-8]|nr:MAG: hypothetical protein B7Z38_04105 [Rhodobacterales bacterium 12-64-8]OYX45183.1 MAG: hypothetical protein B7Y90_18855 [Alphaproteobacteria bacterium 32-64-14]